MIAAMSVLGALFVAYCAGCAVWAGCVLLRACHRPRVRQARAAWLLAALAFLVAATLAAAVIAYTVSVFP